MIPSAYVAGAAPAGSAAGSLPNPARSVNLSACNYQPKIMHIS
jgi:hypothetical protein